MMLLRMAGGLVSRGSAQFLVLPEVESLACEGTASGQKVSMAMVAGGLSSISDHSHLCSCHEMEWIKTSHVLIEVALSNEIRLSKWLSTMSGNLVGMALAWFAGGSKMNVRCLAGVHIGHTHYLQTTRLLEMILFGLIRKSNAERLCEKWISAVTLRWNICDRTCKSGHSGMVKQILPLVE